MGNFQKYIIFIIISLISLKVKYSENDIDMKEMQSSADELLYFFLYFKGST